MALRIGFKIHRYLGQNKFKFLVHEPTRNTSSRPKYVTHPLRQLKSSSHTNLAQKKYTNTQSYRERDLQVAEMDDLQPSAMPAYFTSTLESNLANFPEKSDLVRRGRFTKSSTQTALTMPLKLPRLANPFPERLKAFPSDTMADDEKAKLMEAEVKMVARYNLQTSQETAGHQPEGPLYYEDDVYWRESAEITQLQPEAPPENDMDDVLVHSRRRQARNKPRTRAARYLKTSRHLKSTNQQRRYSSAAQTDLYATANEERSKQDLDDLAKGSTSIGRPTEQPQPSSRCFSTKSKSCKPEKPKKPTCKPMKSAGCADPNPNKCEYVYEKSRCKKLEAPYPSYSECMGDLYEEDPSECKICPWSVASSASKPTSSSGKKKYSTFAAASPKSKPPCKNPYDDKKPCDYERAAEKQDASRRKRPAQPRPKSKPGHKKSFSTLATARQSFHTLSKSNLSDAESLTSDNATIVERIRGWLNSWRPGSDMIRITQSAEVCAGRETYIIEIQDVVDAEQPLESLDTSSGLSCAESSGKKPGTVPGGGCPPPKKKEEAGDDKKKCRQRKKRKLPACNDMGKNKPTKKDALNYSNEQLTQQTQEINALKEPKVPQNVPFKLKPQFWRV